MFAEVWCILEVSFSETNVLKRLKIPCLELRVVESSQLECHSDSRMFRFEKTIIRKADLFWLQSFKVSPLEEKGRSRPFPRVLHSTTVDFKVEMEILC